MGKGYKLRRSNNKLINKYGMNVSYSAPTETTDAQGQLLTQSWSTATTKRVIIKHITFLTKDMEKEGYWNIGDLMINAKPVDNLAVGGKITYDSVDWIIVDCKTKPSHRSVENKQVFKAVRKP